MGRDECNESAAKLFLEAYTDEDRQGRVQCSFCRELEHEEPSFCRKLAHEEPMREKGVDFSAMACSLVLFLPFFSRSRSPTAAQFASWPAVRPKLPSPFSSLGRPDSNIAALSAAFSAALLHFCWLMKFSSQTSQFQFSSCSSARIFRRSL